VLELACELGVWTSRLLRHATDVTTVDPSPEMLAIAASRVRDDRVRFVQADLFTWVPDRRYDVVFFDSGSRACRPGALSRSGHWWLAA
jgi:ubiquinone/menaquinone biosynthesis C-methylase UbiE